MLIVPVVSSGDEDQPGAVVASAESLLPAEAVAEIEAGLRALNATGASEQVNRLVVKLAAGGQRADDRPGQARATSGPPI